MCAGPTYEKLVTMQREDGRDLQTIWKSLMTEKFQLDAELGMADMASVAQRIQKRIDAGQRVNLQTYEETGQISN